MMEVAKRDKNGVVPSAVVSWLAQRPDVNVALRSILVNQKHQRVLA